MALWLLATVGLHIPHGHFDGPGLISISPDRSSIVQMHGCIFLVLHLCLFDDRVIQCDDCDEWIHIRCRNITPTEYNRLQSISHFTWTCPPYGSINLSTTSINDIDISNPYSSLTEELSNDENDNVFEPTINTTSSEFDEEPPKLQKHTRALN
jgi:hypothetical protein